MNTKPATIAELAISLPGSIAVLERLGIDYCCGGAQTIEQACQRQGITPDELLTLIDSAPQASTDTRVWEPEPMSEMITFIVNTHHRFTREAFGLLTKLATKVREVHGANHSELVRIEELVHLLSAELLPHMLKEEQVLFPYITALEQAAMLGNEPPTPFFGTARNPVRMMMLEHETAGEQLLEIRSLAGNYLVPADACFSFQTLYAKLEEIENDLHRHIHIENNILFPRAIAVEEKTRGTAVTAGFDNCCVGHGAKTC